MAEVWTVSGVEHTLIYLYDENGSPIGLKYRTNAYEDEVFDSFFFEKNLQGDIVAIYNQNGTKIGQYQYDAWGNYKRTIVSGATDLERSIINTYNPFRYRGYYYDVETGWYYLQSRYYNPTLGRFLNADSALYHSMLGYNIYAYCVNNPIAFVDPTGKWFGADDVITGPVDEIIVIGGLFILSLCGSEWAENALEETVGFVERSWDSFAWLFGKSSDDGAEKAEDPPQSVTGDTPEVDDGTENDSQKVPDVKYPGDDPTVAPGDGYEWHGKLPVGGDKGAWVNKQTGEQWHPDLNHKLPKGPHWDYTDPNKIKWSVFPDGRIVIWGK